MNSTQYTTIEKRQEIRSSGAVWTMNLEKIMSRSGKTATYMIYAHGGQSYPVGTFRSRKAAVKMLDSFTNYVKVA